MCQGCEVKLLYPDDPWCKFIHWSVVSLSSFTPLKKINPPLPCNGQLPIVLQLICPTQFIKDTVLFLWSIFGTFVTELKYETSYISIWMDYKNVVTTDTHTFTHRPPHTLHTLTGTDRVTPAYTHTYTHTGILSNS